LGIFLTTKKAARMLPAGQHSVYELWLLSGKNIEVSECIIRARVLVVRFESAVAKFSKPAGAQLDLRPNGQKDAHWGYGTQTGWAGKPRLAEFRKATALLIRSAPPAPVPYHRRNPNICAISTSNGVGVKTHALKTEIPLDRRDGRVGPVCEKSGRAYAFPPRRCFMASNVRIPIFAKQKWLSCAASGEAGKYAAFHKQAPPAHLGASAALSAVRVS
jgi:hypothetical protein